MTYLQENGFGGREPDPPNFNEPCMVAIGEDGEANRLDHLRLRPGELEHLARLRAPEHRWKGICTALFYALRDKAQEQGNIFSILSVRTSTTWPPKQHSKRNVGQKNT
ncbi:hypothetical protein T190_11705 [Sinorhizobium meliloti CCBAU 01290]|nr:hypothetical protein T190_11705 [Sinorhizobium meliloti CCBAU 01290]